MNDTKEIKNGSSVWFCKKSNTAYISKMANGKNYFISDVNKQFLTEDYSHIKNGEYFFITGINILKDLDYTVKLTMSREKDKKQVIIRYEDLFHFCTK